MDLLPALPRPHGYPVKSLSLVWAARESKRGPER